jgi:hypothetical protein
MKDFAEKKGYGNWETMKARSRPILSQVSDAEIALKYSVEMRGFAQYYAIAVNFSAMNNPTTTSVLDRLIFPVYAASKGADHHQEAEDVTGTSNRRRGVLHPAV